MDMGAWETIGGIGVNIFCIACTVVICVVFIGCIAFGGVRCI
jgi:hypothetical protein